MLEEFTGFIAVFMSLLIPIVVIIFSSWTTVNKKRNDKEVKRLIIENNIDIERARLLINEQEKKGSKYGSLRPGLMMIGLGLGALVDYALGVHSNDIYFWLIIAVGVGFGMLTSFFIEMKLNRKETADKEK